MGQTSCAYFKKHTPRTSWTVAVELELCMLFAKVYLSKARLTEPHARETALRMHRCMLVCRWSMHEQCSSPAETQLMIGVWSLACRFSESLQPWHSGSWTWWATSMNGLTKILASEGCLKWGYSFVLGHFDTMHFLYVLGRLDPTNCQFIQSKQPSVTCGSPR